MKIKNIIASLTVIGVMLAGTAFALPNASDSVTEALEAVRSLQPTTINEAFEATQTTKPVKSTPIVESTKVAKSTKAVEATKVAKSTKAVEATKVVESTKAVEATKVVEATKAVKAVKPTKVAGSVKTAQVIGTAKVTESVEAIKTVETIESAKGLDALSPAQLVEWEKLHKNHIQKTRPVRSDLRAKYMELDLLKGNARVAPDYIHNFTKAIVALENTLEDMNDKFFKESEAKFELDFESMMDSYSGVHGGMDSFATSDTRSMMRGNGRMHKGMNVSNR